MTTDAAPDLAAVHHSTVSTKPLYNFIGNFVRRPRGIAAELEIRGLPVNRRALEQHGFDLINRRAASQSRAALRRARISREPLAKDFGPRREPDHSSQLPHAIDMRGANNHATARPHHKRVAGSRADRDLFECFSFQISKPRLAVSRKALGYRHFDLRFDSAIGIEKVRVESIGDELANRGLSSGAVANQKDGVGFRTVVLLHGD